MLRIFAILALFVWPQVAHADACAKGTEVSRITDQLAAEPDRPYFTIEAKELSLFIKNINDLYNVGLVEADISKIYVIDQLMKAPNPHFQGVHMFVINSRGCIAYYQTTYKDVIKLLLNENPRKVLGLE